VAWARSHQDSNRKPGDVRRRRASGWLRLPQKE
jgi:hypothetical protein